MWQQDTFVVATRGRGLYDVGPSVERLVRAARCRIGLCHLFLRHTSAALCITENADADVHGDLERFATHWVPDGAPWFRHDAEGPDDMSAHVRSVVVGCELTIPIRDQRLALGTWQGIYVWEHRQSPHQREVVVTLQGQAQD
jgi:secondary thiamine-phosphate synthase enzyme